jgi:signal transduction histidine kinase
MFKTGIRTEILLNLTLLVGAALLFSCILLIKFTEQKLLSQQIENAKNTVHSVIQGGLAGEMTHQHSPDDVLKSIDWVMKSFRGSEPLQGWVFFNNRLELLDSLGKSRDKLGHSPLPKSLRFSRENQVRVDYSGVTFFSALGSGENPGSIEVFSPCWFKQQFLGILVARFSLEKMVASLNDALVLVFTYAVFVALIVIGFGYVLLGRTVVGPLNRLEKSTRLVAEGDLDQMVSTEGPSEIFNVGKSFNAMTCSLQKRKRETQNHILQLQAMNADLKETRDELIRSEKLASVGQLAAGMAHEIGNPLGAVQGYLDFLRNESRNPLEKDIIERSLSEIERINRLVRDLLDYSSPGPEQEESFDPAEIAREAIEILKSQGVLDQVEICDELPRTMPPVCMSRHKLIQVMVNLLLNARDAMDGVGTITLASGEDAELVWMTVVDTGGGIQKENLHQIFDPFYTTKKSGKGRGLGLSVCQRILKEAGGYIEPRSEEGSGAEFKVALKKLKLYSNEKEILENTGSG